MPATTETPQSKRTAAALRARGYRVTPQRLAIQEIVESLGRHVSADEVAREAATRLPGVSLPTVYSALDALEDAGLLRRVAAGRGAALYDAGPEHHHLVCRRCGRVEDLEADLPLSPALSQARRRGFAPEGAEVVVRGLCRECRREEAKPAGS
jgi:Fur family transcriptional regulator, stress-responsive regulator